MFTSERSSEHRGADDLLSAGLGLDGLRAMTPPAFADAARPTAAELRRRALWHNWRGIADLAPGGGFGEVYGNLAKVPGREYSAYARLPGARQPHRVLVQVPDAFDAKKRCVVVSASSGSRGIYGAIAVAGAWGLPKGCAVAYTDKGAGTDYFDLDAQAGARADGTPGALGVDADLAFVPDAPVNASGVAFKHAHSQDNPEADWGRHVKQAAEFALHALGQAMPEAAPFTFDNTRVIAVGISNGGGAVLRAAELDGTQDWLDAVVAGEPNVQAEGARSIYDYSTEAALLMPCALLHLQDLAQPPLRAQVEPLWAARCASLKAAGLVEGGDAAAQAASAYARMLDGGWSEASLRAGALSAGFDLWRAVAATYASAYGRYGVGEHPCGYAFAAQGADLRARAASAGERAAWWSDAAGIPPGAGVGLLDAKAAAVPDPGFAGLQCLRALNDGESADALRVRKGIAEVRAGLPRRGLPVIVVHGTDDGLVPIAFSSRPWVAQAQAAGRDVRYWQVRHAQHFDAFLGLPDYAARYVPLLPYVYAALDRVDAALDGAPLPASATIETALRGAGKPLTAAHLALPR
ncbi:D-(-)-3-hydroxybutyrate oligomer hydrolase [Luteimonas aquatica]|uniref:D-(-)-3-hydroxybutyrate oligomer hydrolase n=1 Tax=Luteimonas aquatica TaxID=450364 RepID=UPI001F57C57E